MRDILLFFSTTALPTHPRAWVGQKSKNARLLEHIHCGHSLSEMEG